MKRILLAATLFLMLAAITPAYAGDVDGLWYGLAPDESTVVLGMAKENSGYLLFTFLDYWQQKMAAWIPIFGPFDGRTGNLSLLLTSEANGNIPESMTGTFTLTSAATATVTIIYCVNFPNQENCSQNGTTLHLTKIF